MRRAADAVARRAGELTVQHAQYDERVQIRRVPVQLPGALMPLLDLRRWRFKILYGGRGGAKSHSIAQALIMLADQLPLRIACCREVQKTLAESSKQVIEDYVDRLGVADSFATLKNAIVHRRTGSTFGFHGLREHTAKSIKSLETCTSPGSRRPTRSARSWRCSSRRSARRRPARCRKSGAVQPRQGRRLRLRPLRGAHRPRRTRHPDQLARQPVLPGRARGRAGQVPATPTRIPTSTSGRASAAPKSA